MLIPTCLKYALQAPVRLTTKTFQVKIIEAGHFLDPNNCQDSLAMCSGCMHVRTPTVGTTTPLAIRSMQLLSASAFLSPSSASHLTNLHLQGLPLPAREFQRSHRMQHTCPSCRLTGLALTAAGSIAVWSMSAGQVAKAQMGAPEASDMDSAEENIPQANGDCCASKSAVDLRPH